MSRLRLPIVFVTALLIRLVYLYLIRDNPFFYSPIIDAQTYDELAMSLVHGSLREHLPFWQPPLYPTFLAIIFKVFGHKLLVARLIQATLGAVSCALLSQLATRIFDSRVGWLSGLLLAFYGPLVYFDGELLVPSLSILLDLLALLCLVRSSDQMPRFRDVATAGLLLGISAIARPTILPFVLAMVGWLLCNKSLGRRLSIAYAMSMLLLVALPISTVSVLNMVIGKDEVLISSNGGVNFYLGNNDDYDTRIGIRPGIAWKRLMREPGLAGKEKPSEASRYWLDQSIGFISEHPLSEIGLLLKKSFLLIHAYEIPRNLDYNYFVDKYIPLLRYLLSFGILFPLAMPSIWSTRKNRLLIPIQLYLLTNAVTVIAFFVVSRYRINLVPLLTIYAAFSLTSFWTWARASRYRAIVNTLGLSLIVYVVIHLDPFKVQGVDRSEGENLEGKAYSNLNDHRLAIQSFQSSIQTNPLNIDAHFNLGRELQISGRCDEALVHYSVALEHFPEDRDTLSNMGLCLLVTGKLHEGIGELEKVVLLYPDTPEVFINISEAYKRVEDFESARRSLEEGVAKLQNNPMLRRSLEEVNRILDEMNTLDRLWSRARQNHEEGRNTQPAISESEQELNNAGYLLLVQKKIQPAKQKFMEALDLNPDYHTAWGNLGQAYYLAGSFSMARRAFEHSTELNPVHWPAWMGLALTLGNGLDDKKHAVEILTRVIRQAPRKTAQQARQWMSVFQNNN